jgi:hypothetical protein
VSSNLTTSALQKTAAGQFFCNVYTANMQASHDLIQNELEKFNIQIERYSLADTRAMQMVSEFVSNERLTMNARHDKPFIQNEDYFNHVLRLAGAKALVTKDYVSRADAELSFVDVARSEGKIIGVSVFILDRSKSGVEVIDNFFGVGWDFTRKGVAKQLVTAGHQHLQELGVYEYKTSVWSGSKGVVEKVTGIPLRPDNDAEGKHFWVKL